MRAAVVIPAFQAAATVGAVLARVRADAVYLVDDGSTDGTGETGLGNGATVLRHPQNRGKGAALTTGIVRALADGADAIVTLDADGQHPPDAIPGLLAPIADGWADIVLGARIRDGSMPFGRRFTNWLSARLASRIGGQDVPDAQTGFRAFTRAVAERVRPGGEPGAGGSRYEYETAFLLEALAAGFRVTSVPIPTIYGQAPSHFRPWADGWRIARVYARHARRMLAGAA